MTRYTKAVSWSYPTSPNAKRFGYYHDGCYVVAVAAHPDGLKQYVAGYPTFEQARAHADALPHEWSRWTLTAGHETTPTLTSRCNPVEIPR